MLTRRLERLEGRARRRRRVRAVIGLGLAPALLIASEGEDSLVSCGTWSPAIGFEGSVLADTGGHLDARG